MDTSYIVKGVSILMLDHKCFRRWELAMLLGLGLSLLLGSWLSGQQAALAGQVVRLHVIGASDSAEDQVRKLKVRDAVLEAAAPCLEGVSDPAEARRVLAEHLPFLAQAGAQAAGMAVQAELEDNAWFPTRRYLDFALPAGRYTALKLTVGEGEGRNWWCVVFPPLCMGAVSEQVSEVAGNFSDSQVKLITGESEGYVVKFKVLELWEQWTGGK